jgi:hypothetical protein
LVVAGLVILLALSGTFGAMAVSLAGPRAAGARADASAIMWGALGSGLALAVVAVVAIAAIRGRLQAPVFALIVPLVVGGDLWLNARAFWLYAPNPKETWLRPDPVTTLIGGAAPPYRVLDTGVYGADALMAFNIPQVLGYHGNEIRYYDELLGGKGEWSNLRFLHLWDLLAVRYALIPADAGTADSIPGFKRVLNSVATSAGTPANVFERIEVQPYARVVPGATKVSPDQIVPTLIDPRMPFDRFVLFDSAEAINPLPLTELPPPSPSQATFTRWVPGEMSISLNPPPPADSYLLISENWFPDWRARVDGNAAQVLRGDHTFLTVPVKAGSKNVELEFVSREYVRGRLLAWVSLLLVAAWGGAGGALAWRKRRGGSVA